MVEAKLKEVAVHSFRPSRDLTIYRTLLAKGDGVSGFTKDGIITMVGGVSKENCINIIKARGQICLLALCQCNLKCYADTDVLE